MDEMISCPFCGGKSKVSFKDYRFIAFLGNGEKVVVYRVQVICNKCKSRGKPIFTKKLVSPNPYATIWGKHCVPNTPYCQQQTSLFMPYVEKAIAAWNNRKEVTNASDFVTAPDR